MKIFKTKKQREEEKAQKQLEIDRATVRKPDDIGREYNALCAEAGDKQYRKKVIETELEQINQRLYSLNQEFSRSTQVHPQTPKLPAAPTTATPAPVEAPAPIRPVEEKSNEAQLQ
jgi:hypothetical protein